MRNYTPSISDNYCKSSVTIPLRDYNQMKEKISTLNILEENKNLSTFWFSHNESYETFQIKTSDESVHHISKQAAEISEKCLDLEAELYLLKDKTINRISEFKVVPVFILLNVLILLIQLYNWI